MKNANNTLLNRTVALLLGAAPFIALPVNADDIEIYVGATSGGFEEQIRPNVLYVIDTSGSMDKSIYLDPAAWWAHVPNSGSYAGLSGPYDPTKDYSALGTCNKDSVYYFEISSSDLDASDNPFLNDDGYPVDDADPTVIRLPDCGHDNFPKTTFKCQAAMQAFTTDGKGWYDDYVGSYWPVGPDLGGETMDGAWHTYLDGGHSGVETHNGEMILRECRDDFGNHGDTAGDSRVYPNAASDSDTNPWTSSSSSAFTGYLNNNHYMLADGNFLNWFHHAPRSRVGMVQAALGKVLSELPPEINVGLMRFDSAAGPGGTDGGMMIHEFVVIGEGSNRETLIESLYDIPFDLDASTPLSETMYEAFLVFAGERPYFGAASDNEAGDAQLSIPASIDSATNRYKSPITATCQPNSIIYFTDGAPSSDKNAFNGISDVDTAAGWDGGFDKLPGLAAADHADYAPISPYFYDDGTHQCNDDDDELGCLPTLAHYMQNEDVNPFVAGIQTVSTHTIGFSDPSDSDTVNPDYLRLTADVGGGVFHLATDAADLDEAFRLTTRKAVTANTAFAAPALAVNAFNRTQDGNRVYFALFKSSTKPGWRGNLKAYELAKDAGGDIIIVDRDGNPAVDPDTGLFHFDARSFWSDKADGNQAPEGGAASNIDASTREIYSWFGNESNKAIVDDDHKFVSGNSDITDAMLGMDGSEPAPTVADPTTYREKIFQWMTGINPADGTERLHMGDPLHSRPVVVQYGTTETSPDQKIFVTTNDGMLHVINAESGAEEFAFMAEESMKNAKRIYSGDSTEGKAYGMDGALQVWVDEGDEYEAGIEAGETVYLYAPMRRGGRSLYAFDMTNPASPEILWRIRGGDIDGDGTNNDDFFYLGQTWSSPQLGKLRISNAERKVLIFGGGYDPKQDDPDGNTGTDKDAYIDDDMGNAIYIVDAKTGDRLWWAGGPGSGADLEIPEMVNSIPSDVAVIDVDNDSWTDRLYVGDTGGRIFRIDLPEFNSTGSIAATGGMIADVGGSSEATSHPDNNTIEHNRKFFYAPDIVTVENGNDDYLAIAIGSGNRAHPSYPIDPDPETNDMFFVFKDPNIMTIPTDYDYGINMEDVTSTNPNGLYDATSNDIMSSDPAKRDAALTGMANAQGGWYIELVHNGEKALAPAVTLNYKTYFTTFEPLDLDLSTCQARTGIGRLYALDLRTGMPVNANFANDEDVLETEDRAYELKRDGIAPALVFTFPEADDGKTNGLTGPELPPANFGSNAGRSYWRAQ